MKNSQENKDKNSSSASIDDTEFDEFDYLNKLAESWDSGEGEYELAIKELIGSNPNYVSGMEHMIEAAKKGNPDALNWLVDAGIRIVIPDVLWDKKNFQDCKNYVLKFCSDHDAGPHKAMARFFRGLICLSGQGVAKSEELGIHFLKQAAEGPFLNELGNEVDNSDEHNGRDLINIYLDILSEKVATENIDGEYWNLNDLGRLLCNGLNEYWPFLYIDKYFILSLRSNVFIQSGEYFLAEESIDSVLKNIRDYEKILFEPFRKILFQQVKLEKANQSLKAKESELEETMAMFAHKFRSPLDAILYNTSHEHQPKLYIQAAQTMQGLLEIFSMIATDSETLVPKIQQDSYGSGRLATVLERTLDMILLHLLSAQAAAKIQQHYLHYAKAHDLCDAELSDRIWKEEYFELERLLQVEWEQSYAQLLADSATLEQRLDWLEQRFFKLEVHGFERSDIQFREYGDTESLLTIVLNEVLVNAFKYYGSPTRQSVVLEWLDRDRYQILRCQNPSQRNERNKLKGSRKGHVFLSSLARKTASEFSKPKAQDEFVLEFGFASELLISS